MEASKPKVSVILPTYNRGGIIEDSISSVLNQTYKQFDSKILPDNYSILGTGF